MKIPFSRELAFAPQLPPTVVLAGNWGAASPKCTSPQCSPPRASKAKAQASSPRRAPKKARFTLSSQGPRYILFQRRSPRRRPSPGPWGPGSWSARAALLAEARPCPAPPTPWPGSRFLHSFKGNFVGLLISLYAHNAGAGEQSREAEPFGGPFKRQTPRGRRPRRRSGSRCQVLGTRKERLQEDEQTNNKGGKTKKAAEKEERGRGGCETGLWPLPPKTRSRREAASTTALWPRRFAGRGAPSAGSKSCQRASPRAFDWALAAQRERCRKHTSQPGLHHKDSRASALSVTGASGASRASGGSGRWQLFVLMGRPGSGCNATARFTTIPIAKSRSLQQRAVHHCTLRFKSDLWLHTALATRHPSA